MDLCVMIEGQEDVSWPQWLAIARACETHGISTLFRSDHYMNFDGLHPERVALDAWGTICALASVTSTLRLGTMVSPASFRHPSELAKLVVTADHVSGGRIELGLGAGWHEPEHTAYGFPFGDTRTRMDILEEQLEVVLGNWGPGAFSLSGKHYTLKALDARPKPVQTPHPPVIVGGVGGRRSIRLSAAYGTEYNTPLPTLEQVRERIAALAAACHQVGRDPIPLSTVTPIVVGRNDQELRYRVTRIAALMNLDPDELASHAPAGWVVGKVEAVAAKLLALRDAGVHRVICLHFDHTDLDAIAVIAEQLQPLVVVTR